MKATPKKLNFKNVIIVDNYIEAAGIIASMKEGIDYRMTRRPVSKLKKIS